MNRSGLKTIIICSSMHQIDSLQVIHKFPHARYIIRAAQHIQHLRRYHGCLKPILPVRSLSQFHFAICNLTTTSKIHSSSHNLPSTISVLRSEPIHSNTDKVIPMPSIGRAHKLEQIQSLLWCTPIAAFSSRSFSSTLLNLPLS